MTAIRLRLESGDGPVPEPTGRPAPARRPPQVDVEEAFLPDLRLVRVEVLLLAVLFTVLFTVRDARFFRVAMVLPLRLVQLEL